MSEVIPVARPPTPPGTKVLLDFEKRNGREDNLMYRLTEDARGSIINETQIKEITRRISTSCSQYDFRRDFLKMKQREKVATP